jgi:hypothetical protein
MIRPIIREIGRVPLHHAWTGGKVRVHVCPGHGLRVKLVKDCSSLDEPLLFGPEGCLEERPVNSYWITAQPITNIYVI